jgi:hypothetical protein
LAELAGVADRARHPALTLTSFLDDLASLAGFDDDVDYEDISDEDLLATGVTPAQLHAAILRRAALVWAANHAVTACLADLAELTWHPDTGLPLPGARLEEGFVWRWFPPRHRPAYTRGFHQQVAVCAVKVSHDLARPDAGPPACIAEELLINAITTTALTVMRQAGLGQPWQNPSEVLLEDIDFEILFDPAQEHLAADPATQAGLGLWVPGPADWFTPFSADAVVHPYCQTQATGPQAHDLNQALDADTHQLVLDPGVVDDPAPITGLDPLRDAAAARTHHPRTSTGGVWVPDPSDPENSFAQLTRLTGHGRGSGWLTWQPDEDPDSLRGQPVLLFRAHRHFPTPPDQPWAEVVTHTVVLYVPLAAVVAYRPDPHIIDLHAHTAAPDHARARPGQAAWDTPARVAGKPATKQPWPHRTGNPAPTTRLVTQLRSTVEPCTVRWETFRETV